MTQSLMLQNEVAKAIVTALDALGHPMVITAGWRSVAEQRACYVNLGQGPLMVWRALYFSPAEAQPAPAPAQAEWARGAYLVQGLGHCGACHTPRAATQQELAQDESKYYPKGWPWKAPKT